MTKKIDKKASLQGDNLQHLLVLFENEDILHIAVELHSNPNQTTVEISRKLGIEETVVFSYLTKLENAGLVQSNWMKIVETSKGKKEYVLKSKTSRIINFLLTLYEEDNT